MRTFRKIPLLVFLAIGTVIVFSSVKTVQGWELQPNSLQSGLQNSLFNGCANVIKFDTKIDFQKDTTLVSDDKNHDETLFLGQNRSKKSAANPFGVWGNIYGFSGRIRPYDSEFEKIENSDLGMQIGLDLPGKALAKCLYYSYGSPKHSVAQASDPLFDDTKFNATNHLLGLRLSKQLGPVYFLLNGNLGYDKYKVNVPNISADIFDGSGWQAGLYGEGEFALPLGKWTFKPSMALDYRFLQHNDINNSVDSLYNDETYNAFNSIMGVRTYYSVIDHCLDVQVRTEWVHQFLKQSPIYALRFDSVSGMSTSTQLFFDGNPGRDWFWFGTGLQYKMGKLLNAFVDYDMLLNKYTTTHIGSATLIFSF